MPAPAQDGVRREGAAGVAGAPAKVAAANASATAGNTTAGSSALAGAYEDLVNFQCDKAIAHFVPGMIGAARLSFDENKNKRRLARYLVLIGRAFEFDENEPAASQCYRLALGLDGDDLDATCYLAGILNRTGAIAEAYALYALAERRANTDFAVAMSMASRVQQQFDARQAQRYLRQAMTIDPTSGWAVEELAQTYSYQGFGEKAAALFKVAAARDQSAFNRRLFMGNAEGVSGNQEPAIGHYLAAGQLLPDEPAWHTKLAFIFLDRKQEKKALEEFARPASCRRLSTHSIGVLAEYLAYIERSDDALNLLERLQQLRPWSSAVHTVRGNIYWQNKEDKKAEAEFKAAVAKNPRNPWPYADLAKVYAGRKRNDLAVGTLREGLKYCPGFYSGWKDLGDRLVAMRQYGQAAAAYLSSLSFAPQPVDKVNPVTRQYNANIHSGLGLCLFKVNDMKGAIEEACTFNHLKRLSNPTPYFTWVRLRPDRLNFKQPPAESMIGSAIRHVAVADMLFECDEYADCCAEYRKAIELDPNNLEWHMCLLSALMNKGDVLEAVKEDLVVTNGIVGRAPQVVNDIKRKLEPKKANPAGSSR